MAVLTQTATVGRDYETVSVFRGNDIGATSIVAIYSTALGPALGGLRFFPYPSEGEAVQDARTLARAMAYKSALSGLPLGGGKAVIVGDPDTDKTQGVLRAFGHQIMTFKGAYITACDLGTSAADMNIIQDVCPYVAGSTRHGGLGDPSRHTAAGVRQAMLACAEHVWGSQTLAGRRVGISGVGKVGRWLLHEVTRQGAEAVIADVDEQAVERARHVAPGVEVVSDTAALASSDIDIFAPCGPGGVVDGQLVAALRARVICGAANNQVANEDIEQELHDRGILYAPDFMVNAGGVIYLAPEVTQLTTVDAAHKIHDIYTTTKGVIERAESDGQPPAVTARQVADERMQSCSKPPRPEHRV